MVPWLIEKVAHRRIPYSNPIDTNGKHLFAIGSILQYANSDSYIWGSGYISQKSKSKQKPKQVCAVRGPLTAKRLNELYDLSEKIVQTDPAILVRRYVAPYLNYKSEFKIGIIPHYVDYELVNKSKHEIDSSNINVISVETDNIVHFAREIASCEMIISSSLHGLIISEALGVPAAWVEFSDNVVGNGFKFADYYGSTNRDIKPLTLDVINKSSLNGIKVAPLPKDSLLDELGNQLLECFPSQFY